jgi:hypothetical protein
MDETLHDHDRTRTPQVFAETLTPERDTARERSIARGDGQFRAGEGINGEAVFT